MKKITEINQGGILLLLFIFALVFNLLANTETLIFIGVIITFISIITYFIFAIANYKEKLNNK